MGHKPETAKTCMRTGCQRKAEHRDNCGPHYYQLYRLVRTGKATWPQLARLKKCTLIPQDFAPAGESSAEIARACNELRRIEQHQPVAKPHAKPVSHGKSRRARP